MIIVRKHLHRRYALPGVQLDSVNSERFSRSVSLLAAFMAAASSLVWNWPTAFPLMVAVLLGTGVFLTLRLAFINIRAFFHAIQVVRGKYDDPSDPGDISHFQALTTALSATVGVGNIGGVATAIHFGGPGALFWMWLTAFFGMSTKFSECTLALAHRRTNRDGTVSGGPMYYIQKGLGWKPVALFFAVCASISSCGSGNAIQAFTMADSFRDQFQIPTWLTGAVSATLIGLVIVGGIRRIGQFTARVVPLMAIIYVGVALVVLTLHADRIPEAFQTIVSGAFTTTAAAGGFTGATLGYCLTWGVKRGLFSNEAGQGSAPIAHAAAKTNEPVREGTVALLEPFIDTLAICTLTGLVIITTGAWTLKKDTIYPLTKQSNVRVVAEGCKLGANGRLSGECPVPAGAAVTVTAGRVDSLRFIINDSFVELPRITARGLPVDGSLTIGPQGHPTVRDPQGTPLTAAKLHGKTTQNASPLTGYAFDLGLSRLLPSDLPLGSYLVTLCVFLFALSTAIGWSYYGERSAHYVLGEGAVVPYRIIFSSVHFVGAIVSLETVWNFGDAALGLMSLPNLVALVALAGPVARLTQDYFCRINA